jgi:hypothetical protein
MEFEAENFRVFHQTPGHFKRIRIVGVVSRETVQAVMLFEDFCVPLV